MGRVDYRVREDSNLKKLDCYGRIVRRWLKKKDARENGGHGFELIKQKIQDCGEELRTWGFSKANPNTKEIKQLQRRLDVLNTGETTEESRAEFLGVSKTLDDHLMKQEIYWKI